MRFHKLLEYMPKHHVYYNINVSLRNKYVYFETAKVGCATIKATLQETEFQGTRFKVTDVHNRRVSPLLALYQLDNQLTERVLASEEFYRFGFVRNPYTRILSAYLDKICRNKRDKSAILPNLGKSPNDLTAPVSLAEFLHAVSAQDPYSMNNHWRPQHIQLFYPRIRFHKIGYFEHFESEFAEVLARICPDGRHALQCSRSHNTDAGEKLATYFGPEEKELVEAIYEGDFRIFGYSKELPGVPA